MYKILKLKEHQIHAGFSFDTVHFESWTKIPAFNEEKREFEIVTHISLILSSSNDSKEDHHRNTMRTYIAYRDGINIPNIKQRMVEHGIIEEEGA